MLQYFTILLFWLYFWSNKCRLGTFRIPNLWISIVSLLWNPSLIFDWCTCAGVQAVYFSRWASLWVMSSSCALRYLALSLSVVSLSSVWMLSLRLWNAVLSVCTSFWKTCTQALAVNPAALGDQCFSDFCYPCQIVLPPIKQTGSTVRQRQMLTGQIMVY